MKLKSSSYFLIFIMAIALLLGILAFSYSTPKDWLVPLIASGIILTLGAIRLKTEIMKPLEAGEDEENDSDFLKDSGETGHKDAVFAFLWVVGLTVFVTLFGFLITVPCFTVAYLKFGAHDGWFESIVSALGAELFFYLVFVLALRAELFPGILLGGRF